MRSVVTAPMVKGEVSAAVTALMDPPYLRFCRPCNATHLYEMPFRLGALRAGPELEAGTSPPVLQRLPGFKRAARTSDRYDVARANLRLLGPATPKQVAAYLDAPVKDVTAHWPGDVVEVLVEGESRWVMSADAGALTFAGDRPCLERRGSSGAELPARCLQPCLERETGFAVA
jgi:Winged helix DNA-binding domain